MHADERGDVRFDTGEAIQEPMRACVEGDYRFGTFLVPGSL